MAEWHENREFWELLGPLMFSEERWEQAARDVPAIVTLLGLERGARVLDMACGNGRYAIGLALVGYDVTAVDPIGMYLEDGRLRAQERSLDIEFLLGDMRTFRRVGEFEAVLIMGTSFGIFSSDNEERETVMNMRASLVSGGKLLLEIVGEGAGRGDHPNEYAYGAEGLRCIETHTPRGDGKWVDSHLVVRNDGGKQEYSYAYRIYTPDSLGELMTSCGFHDICFFDDLSGTPYHMGSLKMYAVGTKK